MRAARPWLGALACAWLALPAPWVPAGGEPTLLAEQAAAAGAETRQARFREIATRAREAMGTPGLSAAVVIDDRLAWAEGFGLAEVEHDVGVHAGTVFRIASISKPIAATAVMQLVERGLVSLDDPVQRYVPSFPPKGSFTITLRHLLTHTSGIRHYRSGEFHHRETYDTIDAALSLFMDDPLLFPPGEQYSYTTYGYNLLAGVVERVSGLTFERYLQDHVWTPAGMTATGLEHASRIVKHRARPYVRGGGASNVTHAPYADLSVKWAGGGMISTASDLARFHLALVSGTLLRRDSLELMQTSATLTNGARTGYGLGWQIFTDGGTRWIAHSGGATGGTSYLLRHGSGRLAVVVLTNVEGAPRLRETALALAQAAERAGSAR